MEEIEISICAGMRLACFHAGQRSQIFLWEAKMEKSRCKLCGCDISAYDEKGNVVGITVGASNVEEIGWICQYCKVGENLTREKR